jgi:hypothetical protein
MACDDTATLGAVSQASTTAPAALGIVEFSSETLDFGMVCPERTEVKTLTLENTGDGPLEGLEAQLAPESSSDFSAPPLGITFLGPGDQHTFEIQYAPTGDDQDLGAWILSAGDESWEVPLVGLQGGPELTVTPDAADFGAVPVGEPEDLSLKLRNTGEFSLSIVQVDLLLPEETSPEDFLWVLAPTYPQVLESGESLDLVLRYHPQMYALQSDAPLATIEIQSNDCLVQTTTLPVLGWPGGSDTLCPDDPVTTDVLYGKEAEATDVLFVVDNSESMGNEQAQLADNFGAFVASATALGIDYRIGVTTTDLETDDGALQGANQIVTSTNSDDFLSNVIVGTSGTSDEKGLAAALSSLLDPAKFLGHLRDEAILVVIFVSDEPDNSPGSATSFLANLQGVKSDPSRFIAHAIVGPPSEYGCESADFGPKYTAVAEDSGGVVASICEPSFADALVAFGEASFAAKTRFHLSETAAPDTVSLTVNAVPCETGWVLDATGKLVKFEADAACLPNSGDEVNITYKMVCLEDLP